LEWFPQPFLAVRTSVGSCRAGLDYHVEVEKHYYSVPYPLLRETMIRRVESPRSKPVNVSSAHRHAPDRHRAMPVAPLIPGHARITSFDMWQPSKPLVYAVGTFFVAHYVGAGYGRPHAPDDLLQPPPLAAVVLTTASTGTISTVNFALASVVNAVTDEREDAQASTTNRPAQIYKG
jgi:hypothetical protein